MQDWARKDVARLTFSAFAVFSVGTTLTLMITEKLEAAEAAGLLGVALVSVFLAVGGQNFIKRITKLGPGGVEFERGNAELVLRVPAILNRIKDASTGEYVHAPLTEEQKFAYELGTQLILHQEHLGSSPDDFEPRQLRQYTDLVVQVGRWALSEGEYKYRKALYLLRRLEALPDVTAEGYLLLGEAYRVAYSAQTPIDHDEKQAWKETHRSDFLEKARKALENAKKKDDRKAFTHLYLAWVYCELQSYIVAIEEAMRAMELDERLIPTSFWIVAVAHLKRKGGGPAAALGTLWEVEKGPQWRDIYDDEDLCELKKGEYACNFWLLCWYRLREA